MATKTRHKSFSPSPAPIAPLMMTAATPSAPTATTSHSSAIASTLSKDMFPSPPRTDPAQQQQRRSELAILNYHNARPSGQSSIILPPASALAAGEGHMLGEQPAGGRRGFDLPPLQSQQNNGVYLPFGWKSEAVSHERHQQPPKGMETSRNLSIQSLISAPAALDHNAFENGGERGMKRKGSDIIDRDDDAIARSSRGTSVISTTGLSMEDPDVRDAVEALGGLKADFAHPLTAPNSPPNHAIQQEPLINLIQSSASSVHPLLSTALSISSSTYNASKNYIPPFRYVAESAVNVAAPVVRRTGLENYIRRGLTRHCSNDKAEPNGGEKKRRKSEKEPTPATPEKQLVEVQSGRERGWQTRLYYSSTGLATALSDESRRSLKYCLKILLAANGNLMKVIATLTNVVDELDQYLSQKQSANPASPTSPPSGVAGYLGEGYEQRRQHLAETVDRLKDEALKTLKVVVDTISRYAGGALPEQARNVVKRQLLSFPLKWQAATSCNSAGDVEQGVAITEPEDDTGRRTKGKAVRVLVMAREGLEMMRGVAEVVDGTLVSAEEWCERFGKKTDEQNEEAQQDNGERKRVSWMDTPTAAATAPPERETDGDVSMAKTG